MKATELIKRLQELVEEYGDLESHYENEYDDWYGIRCVDVDKEGRAIVLRQLPM